MRGLVVASRPWFWLPAMGVALSGYLAGGGSPSWAMVLVLILAGPCISGFAESYNDLCDASGDVGGRQHYFCSMSMAGGSGAIPRGLTTRRELLVAVIATVVLALALASLVGATAIGVVAICLTCAFLYSAPGVKGKSRPFAGQLLLFLGYGPLAFGLGYVIATGGILPNTRLFILASLFGIYVVGTGLTADILDAENCPPKARNIVKIIGATTAILVSAIVAAGGIGIIVVAGAALGLYVRAWLLIPVVLLAITRAVVMIDKPSKRSLVASHAMAIVLEACVPLIVRYT